MWKKCKYFLYVFLIISIMLFILSFSIMLPIVIKPFYYYHLSNLDYKNIKFNNGELNYDQLKLAYNELFDYLVLFKKFGTGKLDYSSLGMAHFADVKRLILIDFIILGFSLFTILLVFLISKFTKIRIKIIKSCFIASTILLGVLIIVIGLVISNYDVAFRKFHELFFAGKTNWIFEPSKDEIIKILPSTFFKNSAIFIASVIIFWISLFIFLQLILFLKRKRKQSVLLH
ncbi:TIGR01906 family membrane protein [Mycoplasma sp. 527]